MNIVNNNRSVINFSRHTLRASTESDNIGVNKFPAQLNLIGSKLKLKYKDRYLLDRDILTMEPYIRDNRTGEMIYSRPKDDSRFIPREVGPAEGEAKLFEEEFLVLRADGEEPFRMIAVNEDWTLLLVNSTRGTGIGYEYETLVSIYPIQMDNAIGAKISTYYRFDEVEREAYILRLDTTDTSHGIYIEKVEDGESSYTRYLFEDEVLAYFSEEEYHRVINTRYVKDFQKIGEIRKNIIDNIV